MRFDPAVSSPTGGAFANSVQDMTGDGRADLVASDYFHDRVRVLQADEDGSLTPLSEIPVTLPLGSETADFDGNAILDLAAISDTGDHASALGIGGGLFAPPQNLPFGAMAGGIRSADFDRDGSADLALSAGPGSIHIQLLMGDGAGGFTLGEEIVTGVSDFIPGIVAGELTGDSAPDIAAFFLSIPAIRVYPNLNGTGFGPAVTTNLGFSPAFGPAIDLDGDGDLDLVGTDRAGGSVRVLFSVNGSFVEAASLPAPDIQSAVAIADFDRDGHYDLAYETLGGELRILRGLSPTLFEPSVSWPVPAGSSSVLAADVDGNGWVDVVRQDYNLRDTVEVYLNRGCSVVEIPTLDRTGLATLVGLLAVAAFLLLRRPSHAL